jgi:hypothetical protein
MAQGERYQVPGSQKVVREDAAFQPERFNRHQAEVCWIIFIIISEHLTFKAMLKQLDFLLISLLSSVVNQLFRNPSKSF